MPYSPRMGLASIVDRSLLAAHLTRNRELHLYELGDLHDFFFPRTRWLGWWVCEEVEAVCLEYQGSHGPTLLAFAEPSNETAMRSLLEEAAATLPRSFYAHLTPGLSECLHPRYELRGRRPAFKMALRSRQRLASRAVPEPTWIGRSDLESVQAFYCGAYPANWFDARMLETGAYCGIRDGEEWLAIAGVHVLSRDHRVAALGNIATAAHARGRGHGSRVTAALCQSLLRSGIEMLGLNVMRENAPALACYRKLGFEVIAEYEEVEARLR
jgi:ribosomal protein S18 acetylase RimI-like enzyme